MKGKEAWSERENVKRTRVAKSNEHSWYCEEEWRNDWIGG